MGDAKQDEKKDEKKAILGRGEVARELSMGRKVVGYLCGCFPPCAISEEEKRADKAAQYKKKKDEAAAEQVKAFSKKDEKLRPTKFYFKIDKISSTFEQQLQSVFFEFEIGGQMLEVESEEVVETKVKKTRVDKSGKSHDEEIVKRSYKKRTKVKKAPCYRYYTRARQSVRAKTLTQFSGADAVGLWEGTYKDLDDEYVTIRLWSAQWSGPNILLAEGKEPLVDIASTKMDREFYLTKQDLSGRDEVICKISFKMEFQEYWDFLVDFREWECGGLFEAGDEEGEAKQSSTYRRLKFVLDRSRSSFLDDAQLYFQKMLCMGCGLWQKSGNVCVLPLVDGASRGKVASLSYPGTRAWLEDESLGITLTQTLCAPLFRACFCLKYPCSYCYKYTLSEQTISLQGVLDYGYVMTDIEIPKDVGCVNALIPCCRTGEKELVKLKGSVNCQHLPMYRQIGNVDPAPGSQWLNLQAGETYLVVKVMRAKGLYSLGEFKENLNPSVVVEFRGVRKQTRVLFGTGDPFWDDDVFFKIPDKTESRCPGFDAATCNICSFISRKTKVPKSFESFTDVGSQPITLSVWDNDGLSKNPLGFCNVSFKEVWFGREEEKLVRSINSSSGDKVKRWTYKGKLPLGVPSDGSNLPPPKKKDGKDNKDSKAITNDRNPERYLEFEVFFDRADNVVIAQEAKQIKMGDEDEKGDEKDDKKKKKKKKDEVDLKDSGVQKLTPEMIERAKDFWDLSLIHVPERARRYMTFYGRDEYSGHFHFLPTFVKPMNPPTDIQRVDELLYFIYSVETVKKNTKKPDVASIGSDEPWVWADPYFFMEKRKGDVKDHALLLCNFLLGLGYEAYICIGCATSTSDRIEPHVWVMTLEPSYKEAVAKNIPASSRIVRFWETINGKTYELSNRFSGDEAKAKDNKSAEAGAAGAAKEGEEGDQQDKQEEKAPDAAKQGEEEEEKKKMAMDEEDEKKQLSQLLVQTKVKEVGLLGPTATAMPQKQAAGGKYDEEDQRRDLEDMLGGDIDLKFDQHCLEMSVDVKLKSEAKRSGAVKLSGSESIFDAKLVSRVELERQTLERQRDLQKPFKDEQAKEQLAQIKTGARKTPYISIDIVFNNSCLYANKQQRDPEAIKYDMKSEARWCRFTKHHWQQFFRFKRLTSFYPNKAMVSLKAGTKEIDGLEKSITERIKDSIRIHRSYQCSFDTTFLETYPFQHRDESASQYVMLRLEFESKYGERDEALHILANDGKLNEVEKQERKRQDWRNLIIRSLERGQMYTEKLFHFKHTDGNRISDLVLNKFKECIELDDSRSPKFVVAVKITQLPAQISPVRVYIGAICKDSQQQL